MFQPQFSALILSGRKRQTIRALPKRIPKPGDLESWRQWSALPYRSKQVELVRVKVTLVLPITISSLGIIGLLDESDIVQSDGFETIHDMINWFSHNHGLPFTGILIRAKDL